MKALVFLGGGRITSALIAGLRLTQGQAEIIAPQIIVPKIIVPQMIVPKIIVHDRNPEKLRELRRKYRVGIELDLHRAVAQAGLLVIAVRPDSVRELLGVIGPPRSTVCAISLAAGIPLRKLRQWRPGVPWVRAMPSPAARFGKGLTALAFESGLPRKLQKEATDLFARVGGVMKLPEEKFNAFTVTYSISHGYHALAALAQAAEELGLDRKTALLASAHALADGIVAWREASASLDELLKEAATPGGIAATVMQTMDEGGYQKIIESGLRTGLKRTRENAKR